MFWLNRSIRFLTGAGAALLLVSGIALFLIGPLRIIPVHWDLTGSPDLFMPAWVGLLVMPLALFLSAALLRWRSDKFMAAAKRNYYFVIFAIAVLFVANGFIIFKAI
ncbi:DUF1648 domain-containing protein [Phaeobacter sp. B1627]|uniref:DUF1648 domain-containing protein n=1 Tax=Phaeobacter sp. B1627 TaxID=2583809 RepID=UPI001118B1D3|nr:DUF1648 domain-containing protein [Phaeobacter sp. B1627]TNJ40802.1 hypothetical protein FGE21_16330 [Phaeobacter sp. B1627]